MKVRCFNQVGRFAQSGYLTTTQCRRVAKRHPKHGIMFCKQCIASMERKSRRQAKAKPNEMSPKKDYTPIEDLLGFFE